MKFYKSHYASIVLLICIFIYLNVSSLVTNSFLSPYPYYNYFLEALISHQSISISPPIHMDLAYFQGKYFMYWGPSPALFVLPFYLLSGLSASDIIYVLVAGIINIFLFLHVVRHFLIWKKIKLSPFQEMFLVLSFALTSPNFYLSLSGNIWATTQIVGMFYLLIFLLFLFKFLTTNRFIYFPISVIFFNLAWLARYSLFPYILLFLVPFFINFKKTKKMFYKKIFTLTLITLLSLILMASYNNARFGSPFEIGQRYVKALPFEDKIHESNKIFSLSYVPHNFYHYFLNLNFELEGTSIFLIYPFTLLLLFSLTRINFKKRDIYKMASITIIFIIISVHLTLFTTGRLQFGMRYFLDIVPIFLLLLAIPIRNLSKKILLSLLIWGIFINILGTLFYPRLVELCFRDLPRCMSNLI